MTDHAKEVQRVKSLLPKYHQMPHVYKAVRLPPGASGIFKKAEPKKETTDETLLYRVFTPENDEYIIANYRKRSYREIAKEIGRSEKSLSSRIALLKKNGKIERK